MESSLFFFVVVTFFLFLLFGVCIVPCITRLTVKIPEIVERKDIEMKTICAIIVEHPFETEPTTIGIVKDRF
jgi:hypothetical protein